MSEIQQRRCPDCLLPMDVIISGANEFHVCGVELCTNYTDPFDRAEDRRMEGLDIQQEMENGND